MVLYQGGQIDLSLLKNGRHWNVESPERMVRFLWLYLEKAVAAAAGNLTTIMKEGL
jgi:hypothetical protein